MPLRVILHADDFGLNRAVSEGIVRGFERGLLTSTALLANAPCAARAIDAWKQLATRSAENALPRAAWRDELDDPSAPFDLGIHLNLTQGRPLTGPHYPEALLDEQGRFPGIFRLFSRLARGSVDVGAGVRAELVAQITFLLDHGLLPTHLNGHQYIEMMPLVAGIVADLLERFRIRVVRMAVEPALFSTTLLHDRRPASWLVARVKQHFARRFRACLVGSTAAYPGAFFGTSHAGRIDLRLIELFLTRAPHGEWIEIGLHPSAPPDDVLRSDNRDGWLDPLATLRPSELSLLESAELFQLLKSRNVTLGRLSQLPAACASARALPAHGLTSRSRHSSLQM